MRGAAGILVVVAVSLVAIFSAETSRDAAAAAPDSGSLRVTLFDQAPDSIPAPFLRLIPLPEGVTGAAVRLAGDADGADVAALDPVIARGVRLLPVIVTPASREVTRERPVSIDVFFDGMAASDGSTAAFPASNGTAARTGRAYFEALAPLLSESAAASVPAWAGAAGKAPAADGSYLIIAAPQFVNALQPLATWKREKGFLVSLVTTQETGTDRSQIQAYIRSLYETSATPPEYVLLVGDVTQLPTFDLAGNVSDLPYSLVDGEDFVPDLFVGRLPAQSEPQALTLVAKILGYESTPALADSGRWMGRGLVVGGNYGSPTPTSVTRWCRAQMLGAGFARVDSVEYPPSHLDGPARISPRINAGVSVVAYRGWAYGPEGWDYPRFISTNVLGLANGWRLPVVFSFVCLNNRFDENECFGEAWLRAGTPTEPKGAVAFIGNGEHWSHTRFNDAMAIGAFTSIRQDGLRKLGQILLAAKLNLLEQFPLEIPFASEAGESVEFYFHIYNLLGDPDLEIWAGAPRAITVSYPSEIPAGSNFLEVSVADTSGMPVEGARVGVSQGGERLGSAWTDASGLAHVEASFDDPSTPVTIVVTGRNVAPYRGTAGIGSGVPSLTVATIALDDDASGASLGNGDGAANPRERIEIGVTLHNGGPETAAAATATLMAPAGARVIQGNTSFGAIPGGADGAALSPFVVEIDPGAEDGLLLRFGLVASDGAHSTSSDLRLTVRAPALRYASSNVGGGVLRQGASASLDITVANDGSVAASNVNAVLRSRDVNLVTVADSTSTFLAVAPGASAASEAPFTIVVSATAASGRAAPLALVLTDASGAVCETDFSVTIGETNITAPLGPDRYGYWAYDCTDTEYPDGVPAYDWITCSTLFGGSGTKLTIPDNKQTAVDLPFPFVFYGKTYNRILVSDNGWISFDLASYFDYYNWAMPSTYGNGAVIAAFWDNLDPAKRLGGAPAESIDVPFVGDGVYTSFDASRHVFAIEWSRQGNADQPATPPADPVRFDDLQTFEILLFDPAFLPTPTGDGVIQLQYKQVANVDKGRMYATAGIESETEDDGIEYTYSNVYPATAAPLSSGLAVRFTTVPPVFRAFELARFEAKAGAEGVALSWAPGRNSKIGGYRLYRSEGGEMRAFGETDGRARSFLDRSASADSSQEYEVGILDARGREIRVGPFRYEPGARVPARLDLDVVNRSPSRGSVEFRAMLPRSGAASLRVFDVSGRLVWSASREGGDPGPWAVLWDGRNRDGRHSPAGVYLARIEAGAESRTIKTVLLH